MSIPEGSVCEKCGNKVYERNEKPVCEGCDEELFMCSCAPVG
jgi:formylmethanofuran dehydrogenase subunit E